jgi:transcriptional regulator with XRE-family HTH domain
MSGKLDDKTYEDLKEELPKLIQEIQEKKGKTIEQIAAYLKKGKDAVHTWARGEHFPPKKVIIIIALKLKELLDEPFLANDPHMDYEIRSSLVPIFIRRFFPTIPQDVKDLWDESYCDTFQLYNWRNSFSIIKLADFTEESSKLNESYPKEKGIFFQVCKLLPFAKENIDDQAAYLAYGFDNAGKNIGVYLWDANGSYEYPVFIADSITDLINKRIITLEAQDKLQFDGEKYLNETFEKNTKGYILKLDFNTNDSNDIHTHFEKLVAFYETAFNRLNRGTIKFEVSGDLITVSIEKGEHKRIDYNIKNERLFLFIEKINDELNGIDISNFRRPRFYGFYLINEKYIACLRLHIATDLIQKGYINSRFKMLPMLVFYNPKLVTDIFNHYRDVTAMDIEENQKIIPI